ncbi:hypothetical protein CGZ93_17850 [Enemella dayhoffiae]|uniref:Uncharacterized protein n=1 Tax=Enemella dayhoffiae TaxID=2016507 RepID=A0A255GTZ1_9ACTN|nr:hypothetical protein [Enemella dayhoffiae]OYO16624.1 hypothetical protein CGZ93_17850 [Enemella dayhoffiae]
MTNRYVIEGMVNDAMRGRRVAYLGLIKEAENAFRACLDALPDSTGAKPIRVNGRQAIEFPNGGTVLFRSPQREGLRGTVADVVYLDGPYRDDRGILEAIWPMLTSRENGELVLQ